MTTVRTLPNGGGNGYYREPYKSFGLPYIKPTLYGGMFHIDDVNSSQPITCMRSNPNIQTIQAMVCTPNKAELARRAELGLKTVVGVVGPVTEIVETKNGNGETIQVAIDENGEVVAKKKVPPNIVPIALAAAAAWFFLM